MRTRPYRAILVFAAFAGVTAVQGPPADGVTRVTQAEFKKLFDAKQVVIVDARGNPAYKECHIRGAIDLTFVGDKPSPAFIQAAAKLKAAKKTVVTYCACPHDEEGVLVAHALTEHGVADVRALRGGWDDWSNDG